MHLFNEKLNKAVQKNRSWLCIGLDTDYSRLPVKTANIISSILSFNKKIIDATLDLVCCYKINSAFYEKYGSDGISVLQKTIQYIRNKVPVIADAKRCDIGNTSQNYADFVFQYLKADAVTVLPYMGIDAIEPFFKYKDKFVFTVVLSSNPGGSDFQTYPFYAPLYLRIIRKINSLYPDSGFVFGATKPEYILKIRKKKITNLLLIPGIGSQGGDTEKTLKYTFLNHGEGIFNISRAVIFAGQGKEYISAVRREAEKYSLLLRKKN